MRTRGQIIAKVEYIEADLRREAHDLIMRSKSRFSRRVKFTNDIVINKKSKTTATIKRKATIVAKRKIAILKDAPVDNALEDDAIYLEE